GPPKKLRPLPDIFRDAEAGKPPFTPFKKGDRPVEEVRAMMKQRAEMLQREGVAVLLRDAGKHNGLLFTTGSWRGSDRPSATNKLPTAYMAHNHYELLYRLATRKDKGAVTRVEIDISNKFIPGPVPVFNTVGEIRGSDKPEELVICAAHLDSW